MMKFTPSKNEKVIISIRIENGKLKLLDQLADKSEISRNELINQCIDFALMHYGK